MRVCDFLASLARASGYAIVTSTVAVHAVPSRPAVEVVRRALALWDGDRQSEILK